MVSDTQAEIRTGRGQQHEGQTIQEWDSNTRCLMSDTQVEIRTGQGQQHEVYDV